MPPVVSKNKRSVVVGPRATKLAIIPISHSLCAWPACAYPLQADLLAARSAKTDSRHGDQRSHRPYQKWLITSEMHKKKAL